MLIKKSNKSFSVIELLVVVALFFVIATISMPKTDFFSEIFVKNEVEKLFSTIIFLQNKAIASNKKLELIFLKDSYTYPLGEKLVTHKLHKKVVFGFSKSCKGPPSCPRKIIKKAITFRNNKIIFKPNGQISTGTVYFINNQKGTTFYEKFPKALTCSISQVSFIRKYKFMQTKNKWVAF